MIDEKIKSGFKKIVICAPTGSGKSPIAATLAKAFESSFIVTASKSLQDQYQNDFSFLKFEKRIFGFLNLFFLVFEVFDILNCFVYSLLDPYYCRFEFWLFLILFNRFSEVY